MGLVRHNAILITVYSENHLEELKQNLVRLGLEYSSTFTNQLNSYHTVTVVPDGSKEGWQESDDGDIRRGELRKWLRDQRYEDGSSAYEWVEVQYGRDDKNAAVVASEWD